MSGDRHLSVVILYTHSLLGEGLAHVLAAEPGLDVVHVASRDSGAAAAALAANPDVVIFERSEPLQAIDFLKAAPVALLIDVGLDAGPTFTYRREEIPPRPEGILRAIHHLRRHAGEALVGVVAILLMVLQASGTSGTG
jgi:DNA-binding NarL/FixJ family response regulator